MTTEASTAVRFSSRPQFHLQELGLVVVILLLGLGLSVAGYQYALPGHPNLFLNADSLNDGVAIPMSWYAIIAVGMTAVIISGGIDISVGSIMALSAMAGAGALQAMNLCASTDVANPVQPAAWKVLPVVIGVCLGVGILCGLVNGLLVVYGRMHPFIVTLATLGIFRGLATVTHKEVTIPSAHWVLPEAFTSGMMDMKLQQLRWLPSFITSNAGDLRPMPLVITLLVVLAGWFYLSQTVGGREIYAIGGNEEAARFSGLPVGRIKIRIYMLCGLTAGIAGLVLLGYAQSASSGGAKGYELTVIASAVVGGASLLGGRGTALGALLGALVIAMINRGIAIIPSIGTKYQDIVLGCALLIAVAIDNFSEYLRQRKLAGAKTLLAEEKS